MADIAHVAAETGLRRVGQPVARASLDTVGMNRTLARRQVLQQAAQGLVAVGDLGRLCGLEGHAGQTPDTHAVAGTKQGVVVAQRRGGTDEACHRRFASRGSPEARQGRFQAIGARHGRSNGS